MRRFGKSQCEHSGQNYRDRQRQDPQYRGGRIVRHERHQQRRGHGSQAEGKAEQVQSRASALGAQVGHQRVRGRIQSAAAKAICEGGYRERVEACE